VNHPGACGEIYWRWNVCCAWGVTRLFATLFDGAKSVRTIELFCAAKKVRKKAPALDLSPPASGYPAAISEGGTKVFCTAKH
jgi:hypothetical protein